MPLLLPKCYMLAEKMNNGRAWFMRSHAPYSHGGEERRGERGGEGREGEGEEGRRGVMEVKE